MPASPQPVILASPLRGDGSLDAGTAGAINRTASKRHKVLIGESCMSAGIMNFNNLLCSALNSCKEHGAKWFAMIHADVTPEPWWLDTLIDEAEEHDADIMSAVIAIKDARGLTSTALSDPEDPWTPWCRLTMTQIHHEDFPATFDTDAAVTALANLPEKLRVECPAGTMLQANNGCFVYRLDRWSPGIYFETKDRIWWNGHEWEPQFQSEDWLLSTAVIKAGGQVFVTRKVAINHSGGMVYHNNTAWGDPLDSDVIGWRARRNGHVEAVATP